MNTKTNESSLFRRQLKRHEKFAEKNLEKSGKAKGDSGQYEFQWNDLTSEHDPRLMGQLGSIEFSKMARDGSLVGGLLSAYKNLLLSCNWTLGEIKDATAEETKVRDILQDWFFNDNNFETTLYSILRMLELGFSSFNKYYTPYNSDNNLYMMPVLLERIQRSIYRIDYKGEYVEQVTSDGSLVNIPFKDLVFFTFRREGNDLRGVSLLRQCFYDYEDKKEVKAVAKKGIIREMLGMPLGKVPDNVNIDSPEYAAFEALVNNVSCRSFTDIDDGIIIPQSYELTFLRGGFKINEIREHLSYYDSQMAISVLAQFILLGQQGSGGSYSLGADQSDFFIGGLYYIIDYIESQFTKHVIHPAIKNNWSNIDASKFELRGLNLDKKASQEFANILKTLIDSGMLKAQENDEAQIREMYGLNEKEEVTDEDPTPEPTKKKGKPVKGEEEEKDKSNSDDDKGEMSVQLNESLEITKFWNTAKQRDSYLKQQTETINKFSKASLRIIGDKLLTKIRYRMSQSKVQAQGLKDVKLPATAVASYKKAMGQKLSTVAMKAWENAEQKSIPHLKKLEAFETKPSELPSKVLTAFVVNQSDIALDKQLVDMQDVALLTANTASTKGYGLENTLAQVEESIDNYIDNNNNTGLPNSLSVSQSMNYAEMQYYQEIETYLWGYRFQNDDPITNICKSCKGKIYRTGSAAMEMMAPPLHFRCKSYFEPIYKTLEKPAYDDYIPPASVLKEKSI